MHRSDGEGVGQYHAKLQCYSMVVVAAVSLPDTDQNKHVGTWTSLAGASGYQWVRTLQDVQSPVAVLLV